MVISRRSDVSFSCTEARVSLPGAIDDHALPAHGQRDSTTGMLSSAKRTDPRYVTGCEGVYPCCSFEKLTLCLAQGVLLQSRGLQSEGIRMIMNRKKRLAAVGIVTLTILITAIYLAMILTDETILLPRPESWAQPIEMEGVPSLYKVSDDLYRSGQPSAEGMANLEEMGIKTIVNLRLLNSDRDEIDGTSLAYVHIQMEAWDADQEEVVEFLRVVSDPGRVPVLVHCSYGADRTGAMCAVYRIVVQGWTKDEAIREMTQGGFGFHQIWTNLNIWIWKSDLDEIKAQAGID